MVDHVAESKAHTGVDLGHLVGGWASPDSLSGSKSLVVTKDRAAKLRKRDQEILCASAADPRAESEQDTSLGSCLSGPCFDTRTPDSRGFALCLRPCMRCLDGASRSMRRNYNQVAIALMDYCRYRNVYALLW